MTLNDIRLRRLVIFLLLLCLLPFLTAHSVDAIEKDVAPTTRERRHRAFQDKRQEVLTAFQRDMQFIRQQCDEESWPEGKSEVDRIEQDVIAPNHEQPLPGLVRTPEPGAPWQSLIQTHRSQHAVNMYRVARESLRAGFPSLAFTMIDDVMRLDPDHKYARSVLGYQLFIDPERKDDARYAGEWISPFEARMRSSAKPHVYDSRFGWIPASALPRYEQGLRPWKNEWISQEKEAELRRDFDNAWEVRSEHFLVKTNVSLEAGVRLTENLEIFYTWLHKNMAGFFDSPRTLQERFDQASRRQPKSDPEPMKVHYFSSRDEYNRELAGKVPANTVTNGLYWQPLRTSYFFVQEDGDDLCTLFHEATHQILDLHTTGDRHKAAQERARILKQKKGAEWTLCEKSNFWLIEGLACYFESFEVVEGEVRVGRPEFVRFDTARQRLLDPEVFFYLPSHKFFSIGKDVFQSHPNAKQFYTQASGMVHFMMHYQDGMYRDDLITLLTAVYRPDLKNVMTEPSFETIAEVSGDELDRQYRTHMQNLEDQVLAADNTSDVNNAGKDQENSPR